MLAVTALAGVFQTFITSGVQLGNSSSINSTTNAFVFLALRSAFIGSSFMSISTYTGNATSGRDITLNMPGYTPDWIVIWPSTSSGGVTANISTPTTVVGRDMGFGSAITNGILTRGENRVTVGSGLNANGVVYNVLAFSEGTDVEPEPEPDPSPYPGDPLPDPGPVGSSLNATLLVQRRMRRFLIPTEDEFRVFISRLEIDMETGVGISGAEVVGSAPQIMLRWSDDGGMTWGNEHWVSAGRIGRFSMRVIFNRLGWSYNRVYELVVTDPVAWRFVDAYIQMTKGRS